MTTTTTQSEYDVAEHLHVPACYTHACRTCLTCGRVHHGGGGECIRCWTDRHTTKEA